MSNNIKSSNDLSEASDKNQKKIEEKPKNEEDIILNTMMFML